MWCRAQLVVHEWVMEGSAGGEWVMEGSTGGEGVV